MQRDLLNGGELLGGIDSFTDEQRKARQTFIEQELHLPRNWLCEDGCSGLDASSGRTALAAAAPPASAASRSRRRAASGRHGCSGRRGR